MPAIVDSVLDGSIAHDLEIGKGDQVVSINEKELVDLIEYKSAIFSDEISLYIKRSNGEEEIIDIEKDIEEDLGIVFESAVFDTIRPCTNKCVFCFVDQQPKGLRSSLYIKDDDFRLSYTQGTYVTLTNLTQLDKTRIQTQKLGPLYVSVHTTNPDLRVKMLKNPKAAKILEELRWLNEIDIPIHTQIVLCPGFNDGLELQRTLNDLGTLKSNILSIAIVPVGITKYRADRNLVSVDKNKAIEVIKQVEEFNNAVGYDLAFPSDEFYHIATKEYPDLYAYGSFGQLEDGVGSTRLLMDDFNRNKQHLPKALNKKLNLTLATGEIASSSIGQIVREINQIDNINLDLNIIKSDFWGDDITVAGLITGQDLIRHFISKKGDMNKLIIPSVMIRPFSDEFLDSKTISDVEDALQTEIITIEDYYSTFELIDYINSSN